MAQKVPMPGRVDVSTTPRASHQIRWSLTRQPHRRVGGQYPLGLLIISCLDGLEIQQACHPADAIAMAAHTFLYATARALKMGSWKSIQPWLETVKPQDFE
jgi:hypothetical protein